LTGSVSARRSEGHIARKKDQKANREQTDGKSSTSDSNGAEGENHTAKVAKGPGRNNRNHCRSALADTKLDLKQIRGLAAKKKA
jgi:hypothetical protein